MAPFLAATDNLNQIQTRRVSRNGNCNRVYKTSSESLLAQMVREEFDQDIAEEARNRVNLVFEADSDFQKEAAGIRRTFKAEFAEQEVVTLAHRFNASRLVKIEGSLEGWRGHVKQLEAKLKLSGKHEGEPSFAEQREVRDILYEWDSLRVQVAYEQAVRMGDDPMLEAPLKMRRKSHPWCRSQVIEAGRRSRAVRNSPETAKKLATLRQALKLVTDSIASARSACVSRQTTRS
jgi:hypothetical protein